MKKILIPFLSLLICPTLSFQQEIIKNPEKPLNPKTGRVLKIQEEFRITDESGEFFFRSPRKVIVAQDGSIFLHDQEGLFRFDSEGNFLHNYCKKGQGPGEINFMRNYVVFEDKIIIQSSHPTKIIWFDFNGDLIKEFTLRHSARTIEKFEFFNNGTYYSFHFSFSHNNGIPELVDIPHKLMAMSKEGEEIKELISFPIQSFIVGGGMALLQNMLSVPYKNRYLFVSHTPEYLIKLYDCESQKLIRLFNRAYKRVKTPKNYRGSVIMTQDGKRHSPPRPEFTGDIKQMFMSKDLLWIQTSTKDKKRGILIDVFNLDGKFVDSFYINTKGSIAGVHEDFIFIRETDEDDLISIIKYRIIE